MSAMSALCQKRTICFFDLVIRAFAKIHHRFVLRTADVRKMEAGMTKTGATINGATIRKIADEAFAALNCGGSHVLPFATRYPPFGMDDA